MENPCKLLLFGDSITREYAPLLQKRFEEEYPEITLEVINAGANSQTSKNGIERLDEMLQLCPDVVVIGFGMNDWRYNVSTTMYKKNIAQMVDAFEAIGTRVILNTVSPSYNFEREEYNLQTEGYTRAIRQLARKKRLKIADIQGNWQRRFPDNKVGLRDELHPNNEGKALIVDTLMWVVPRKHTTILWQYNGREAQCNYRCPYCYYIGLHNPADRFTGYMQQWHERFKEAFGNQYLVFYLAFGEPTMGAQFPEIIEMIASEPRWQLRITSNASMHLDLLVNNRLAKENRLFINASFHPCEIDIDTFLGNIIYLRDGGVEISVVYVAYPPYFDRLEHDIAIFAEHGFVVHLRRFQGKFHNEIYPWAYTDEEKKFIARYMDDGTIKYMLNQQENTGDISFSGFDFFIVDNAGNVGYDSNVFAPYTQYRSIFGNIHTGNFRPLLMPSQYPGKHEGTVDGVANLVSANYKQLVGNNTLSFSQQGGVYKDTDGTIVYANIDNNFDDSEIRRAYNFPDTGQ